MSGLTLGVDLSRWQKIPDKPIPWKLMRDEGIRFVISKAAHGTGLDPSFQDFWKQSREEGFVRGAYFWTLPDGNIQDQVDAALSFSKPLSDDLPLSADVEEPNTKLRGEALRNALEEGMRHVVEASSKKPLFYTGNWWMQKFLQGAASDFLCDLPLWLAQYPRLDIGPSDYVKALRLIADKEPLTPDIWHAKRRACVIQQFDGDGGLDLPGRIDCDFDAFHGSEDELLAFARETVATQNRLLTERPVEDISVADFISSLASDSVADRVAQRDVDMDAYLEASQRVARLIQSLRGA